MLTVHGCGGVPTSGPTAAPLDTLRYPTAPAEAYQRIDGDSLLIKGASVIDGLGGPAVGPMDVLVRDGRIAQIGGQLDAPDLPLIDAAGLTLMPGMITSHVHLQTPPGAVLRQDDDVTIRALQLLQLRAYLACGFTSVLDAAISGPTIELIQRHLADGGVGPNFFFLAPFLTPDTGYLGSPDLRGEVFRDLWEPIKLPGDVGRQLAAAKPLGPKGVKVTIEEGIEFSIWPIFDEARLDLIREESAKIGTPIYVHSQTDDAHLAALRMKPHVLVHAGYIRDAPSPEVIAGLKQSGTYVISTAAISLIAGWGLEPTFAGDPWIRQRVPILQWQTATHPDSPDAMLKVMIAANSPGWLPNWLAHLMYPVVGPDAEDALTFTRNSARAVKIFHEAGIPWVLGADEGNWPAFTTFFHGVSSQIELEVLEKAGLSRADIVVASTSRPAKMLGEFSRLGSIEVGKAADLILVEKDPLIHGMAALRTLRWTIKDGHARSPAAWLKTERPTVPRAPETLPAEASLSDGRVSP